MSQQDHSQPKSFSLGRILLIAVPAAAIAWGVQSYWDNAREQAEKKTEQNTVRNLLGTESANKLAKEFTDADGDLLADPPEDEAKLQDPDELVFSYYASTEEGDEQQTWKTFTEALSQRTGKPVKYVRFADVSEQLRALREGTLHMTAFGTGAVPTAVNKSGFTPLCCFADTDGNYSYTMKIIVPADSDIKKVEDLRGKRFTFTRPRSNSGYKAALAMLLADHDMQPERDYAWGFSYGHENSIAGVADKQFEAAAVASDVLDREIAAGKISEDSIRTIYESKPFPPGVLGYVSNLTPELREAIRETVAEFKIDGTPLAEYGAGKPIELAMVSYKKDWAPVRDINKAVEEAREQVQ
ncbi:phosphate/phosphite/phosphonate ABC transporter substrate-binding protein [Adhaeretor mobilis]|uniref:Phosphate-import protein PhnD n=1 Tax=Adhaeretor mobilis TaxID=1930276 RepID=A0A517N326_9BACT|nr:phosphate/phosphite/phosphonate ABC transporter substrate-binding protein [Adhaeretor mobilis]QDT01533.1 Phosphate-import protein PhnD precursor [Adhaeretor mobilis]